MKRSVCGLAGMSILAVFVCIGAYAQEQRVALVIGNSDYTRLAKLRNPASDARDMAAALRSLGFAVDLVTNADLPTMEKRLLSFGSRLSGSADAVGFFYYAGHGVQSAGDNYLIPTDADIPAEVFVRTKSLALQSVLDILRGSGNRLSIVVLDACRDNPFSWSRSGARGLIVVGAQPRSSIVAYAAGAGEVALDGTGANGIFTGELLKHLGTPGLDIYDVFQETGQAVESGTGGLQHPAFYSQFYGKFSLAEPSKGPSGPLTTQGTSPSGSLGRLLISVNPSTASHGDVQVELYGPTGKRSFTGTGSSRFSADLEPGSYQLEARFSDDPGVAYQGEATVTAGQLRTISISLGYSSRFRVDQLQRQEDSLSSQLRETERKRKQMVTGGVWLEVGGVLGGAAAGVFWYLLDGAYRAYTAADTTEKAVSYRSQVDLYRVVFWGSGIAGAGLLLWGTGTLLSLPSTADLERNIGLLKAQIQAYQGVQGVDQ